MPTPNNIIENPSFRSAELQSGETSPRTLTFEQTARSRPCANGEAWCAIDGFEGLYEISSFGRVWSIPRTIERPQGVQRRVGRILKPSQWLGYPHVGLMKDAKRHSIRVHRLVAQAFLPNPENKPQVNHLNSDPSDPRLENLEWVTHSENSRHGVKYGRMRPPKLPGSSNARSILTEAIVAEMRVRHAAGANCTELGRLYGVCGTTARRAILGLTWPHVERARAA